MANRYGRLLSNVSSIRILLLYRLKLPGQLRRDWLATDGVARPQGIYERDRPEAHHQAESLDQPVLIPHPGHLLRRAKNWQPHRVDNPDHPQPAQPPGRNAHDGPDQA